RLALEWEARAEEAVDGIRGGAGRALSLSRLDRPARQFPARHRTARRIAPLTLSMAIYSGSCARANRRSSRSGHRGWLPGSSRGPDRQAVVFRFLSGAKRMLAGLARHFASVRARFLGSHRSPASSRNA